MKITLDIPNKYVEVLENIANVAWMRKQPEYTEEMISQAIAFHIRDMVQSEVTKVIAIRAASDASNQVKKSVDANPIQYQLIRS